MDTKLDNPYQTPASAGNLNERELAMQYLQSRRFGKKVLAELKKNNIDDFSATNLEWRVKDTLEARSSRNYFISGLVASILGFAFSIASLNKEKFAFKDLIPCGLLLSTSISMPWSLRGAFRYHQEMKDREKVTLDLCQSQGTTEPSAP